MEEKRIHPPIHPGELLREEFLGPMGMTPEELAEGAGVPLSEVYEIVREKGGVGHDTALRLSRYFGLSEGYWVRTQTRYDREIEEYRRDQETR